jgi:hypothetical protein
MGPTGIPSELQTVGWHHITELQANAPIEDIISAIDRDGGVILNNLVSLEELESIEKEIENHTKPNRRNEDEGFFKDLVPPETQLIGGLVGKSDTLAKICCEHPVLEELRKEILTDRGTRRVEGYDLPYHVDPLLSVSLSFRIHHGAARQRLHRDDGTHLADHLGMRADRTNSTNRPNLVS